MNSKAFFQEDNRHFVIVENAANMEQAEAAADAFLAEITAMDEAGATYERIKVSGIYRDNKYYFETLTT